MFLRLLMTRYSPQTLLSHTEGEVQESFSIFLCTSTYLLLAFRHAIGFCGNSISS